MMPMNVTNNCIPDSHDIKNIPQKRKAEDFYLMDNPKSSRSRLMLDMYTQTDKTATEEITLKQIHDLVSKNSERLHKMEEVVVKLHNLIESYSERSLQSPVGRIYGHVPVSLPSVKRPNSSTPVLTQAQTPINTRPPFTGVHYQGTPSTTNSLPSCDYVTPPNDIGDWDGAQVGAAAQAASVNRGGVVDIGASGKSSIKEDWNCENNSLAQGDPPSGPGCWLGDVNDVSRRTWFSGDPKIIERCESYGVNPVKLALSLTEALFTREEMAASNVRGTRGKEALDLSKIKAIRGHVDYKFPIEEDRMEVRWQLIKPKLDSKCRSQRRLQREQKWKHERVTEKPATTSSAPRQKRPFVDVDERELLLYGSPKTVLNPVVSVYTETSTDATTFSEGHENFLPNPED